jgi:hypothetical protein
MSSRVETRKGNYLHLLIQQDTIDSLHVVLGLKAYNLCFDTIIVATATVTPIAICHQYLYDHIVLKTVQYQSHT